MKKVIISIILALLIVTVAGYFMIKKSQPRSLSPAIAAIPTDVAFFIETSDIEGLVSYLSNQSILWKGVLALNWPQLREYYAGLVKVLEDRKLASYLDGKDVIIAVRRQGKSQVNFLSIVAFKELSQQRRFNHRLSEFLVSYKLKVVKAFYNNVKYYTITDSKGRNYYMAFYKGLFIFTPSKLLFDSSLRQLTSSMPLSSYPEFAKVAQYAGQKVSANIYVNYSNFWTMFVNKLSVIGQDRFASLQNFADWTELDMNLAPKFVRLAGYTSTQERPDRYLYMFYGLEPVSFNMDKIFPAQTFEYILWSYGSYKNFLSNYRRYIRAKDLDGSFQLMIKNFKVKYGFDPLLEMMDKLGSNVAIVNAKYSLSESSLSRYLVIEVADKSGLDQDFAQIIQKYEALHPGKKTVYQEQYQIQPNLSITLHKLPPTDLFKILFGMMGNLPVAKYYVYLGNYLVFAENLDDLKRFVNDYYSDLTLGEAKFYKQYRVNLTPKANITYYIRNPFTHSTYYRLLSKQGVKFVKNNYRILRCFENFSVQYSFDSDNHLFYTFVALNFNPALLKQAPVLWQTQLSDRITTKPFIFINHNTGAKEIVVADRSGNLYLIDRFGKILFRYKLDGPVRGDFYMIDYYHNHKYQIVCNTSDKIYVIDRLGRDVANFPIQLPAEASASVSVYDYEHDGNYRFFIPCKNRRVYLFNKQGKLNPQWLITHTTAPVTEPVQHFLYRGKDYLVFADDVHTYILNRKGRVRIKVKEQFAKAPYTKFYFIGQDSKHRMAYFVTTSVSGKLVFIDLKGNVYQKQLATYSRSHRFMLADLNGDGYYEYIFADGGHLDIYSEAKYYYNRTFKSDIVSDLYSYTFSHDDVRVGFETKNGLIYLVNSEGKLSSGFPRAGSTPFTVTALQPGNQFDLLVGKGKVLVNYRF